MKSARSSASSTQKPLEEKTGVIGKLNRIHHDINWISGGLVLRITKRTLSRQETLEWVKMLRKLADDLEAIVT
jgi:hypothetical protein